MKLDEMGKLWDENKKVVDHIDADNLDELHETHQGLFDKAMDSDIPKKEIALKMNQANERFYYENNLDIGEDFINRKALDDYDPKLASRLLYTQIEVLEKLVLERLRPRGL